MAIAASEALYEHAPVVLLAPPDTAAQAQAASVAVRLGTPLLVTAAPEAGEGTASGADAIAAELARLGATTVLAFGEQAGHAAERAEHGLEVVTAPDDEEALADVLGAPVGDPQDVDVEGLAGAVADLDAADPARLTVPGAPTEEGPATDEPVHEAREVGELPETSRPEALESLFVLASPDEHAVGALATARAAGAGAIVLDDPDPRADSDVIATLADDPPEHVIALGDGFGDVGEVAHRVKVAATGEELPGGGQVLFPDRRFVALYGHPGSDALGSLGEQPLEEAIDRARTVAGEYDDVDGPTVVPTFEIITTIASEFAGADGNYSTLTDVEEVRPWVDAAREEDMYVVLDLQPGRTDFLTQAQAYEELLVEPHVGLALDPEWRLEPDQVHLRQIGSVNAAEINEVVDRLADLTAEHTLPQKLLVLHQFQMRMISDREEVDTSRDELAVLIHADGIGTPELKMDTWRVLTEQSPPPDVWWGWKNFYEEDSPTWTQEETVELEPPPLFISYQ